MSDPKPRPLLTATKMAEISRRLSGIRVPMFAGSGWGSSASYEAYIAYAQDMATFAEHLGPILTWQRVIAPHPDFGDDGWSDEVSELGEHALKHLEAWFAWRQSTDWASATQVFGPQAHGPWEDA